MKSIQSQILTKFEERLDAVEEKISLLFENEVKHNEYTKLKLKEVHEAVFKTMVLKIGQMEMKIDSKIDSLQEKLDKILKLLNVSHQLEIN